MSLVSKFTKEKLVVKVYNNRYSLGKAAAEHVSGLLTGLLKEKKEVRIIFAAAPSQNEFLDSLVLKSIEWNRVTAFYTDEYIGLNAGDDELFGTYLRNRIFERVNFKKVHFFNPIYSGLKDECIRYENLLREDKIDVACLGIGENGHLAFNDPPMADFNDDKFVKVVELDKKCRQQQVNDNVFASLDKVPTHAFTITIPALMSAKFKSIVVPGKTKAEVIKKTLHDDVTNKIPSTILRQQNNVCLHLDKDSASLLSV